MSSLPASSKMRRTGYRAAALIAVAALLFVACDGGEDGPTDTAAEQEETEEVEETPTEETPTEEPVHEEGGPPPGKGPPCPKARGGPRPSEARVMQGVVLPLDGKKQTICGTINLVRLPKEQNRTVMSLDIQGLKGKSTYQAFAHTRACKQDGGPRYQLNGKDIGGKFRSDDQGSVAEVEIESRGIAGKEAVSIVIFEGSRAVACADLRPAE